MEDHIWTYIIKRLTNSESSESRQKLDEWLSKDASHLQQYQEARMLWDLSAMVPPEAVETDPKLLTMKTIEEQQMRPSRSMSIWKYGIAAALFGALLFVSFFFFNQDTATEQEWVIRKATAGQVTELTLPDSSHVWLNSDTEIRFQKNFGTAKQRIIQLRGEAYFEVKHDAEHPFVVNSGNLKTTVYGTSFNVRAYPNDLESQVSVNTGKVGVQAKGSKAAALMLLPSDRISFSKGSFSRSKINLADVDSWKSGELIFEQTPMPEVISTISRKYKVAINTGTNDYSACKLSARFSNQSLSEVLKTLNISMNISSKQIAGTIYLKGGNCM